MLLWKTIMQLKHCLTIMMTDHPPRLQNLDQFYQLLERPPGDKHANINLNVIAKPRVKNILQHMRYRAPLRSRFVLAPAPL
jgi:hypothetical protein